MNIQEKIQRKETKIINDNEESKKNEDFSDAIQKLAACHMLGFEPLTVIRQKILTKIQTKYSIDEENMRQLSSYFESNSENDKEESINEINTNGKILKKGLLKKKSPYFYYDIRKIVLYDTPRIEYIDPEKSILKGNINLNKKSQTARRN